ncbi:MAG: hypothetical protein D6705_02445 [Deltaproteobacteria bacterium]|nr:MAG: hypothetical protein D6705_02445 [Deltaproteobacteria bacterium]
MADHRASRTRTSNWGVVVAVGLGSLGVGFGVGWMARGTSEPAAGEGAPAALRPAAAAGDRRQDRKPSAKVAARRVVVRVPSGRCTSDDDDAAANAGVWPPGAPAALRPEGIEQIALEAAREAGFEWDYDIDCSAYPCIVWAPYASRDDNEAWNVARNAWAQRIFNELIRQAGVSRSSVGAKHGIAEVFVLADPDGDEDERALEAARERIERLDRSADGADGAEAE